ncbi:MAG: RNA chaperone Hfq [Christensenellales bacterium]
MNRGPVVLQDVFLNLVRKERINVKIILQGGTTLEGYVKGFDNFTIILDSAQSQMMIYKHAVCALLPDRAVMNGG